MGNQHIFDFFVQIPYGSYRESALLAGEIVRREPYKARFPVRRPTKEGALPKMLEKEKKRNKEISERVFGSKPHG